MRKCASCGSQRMKRVHRTFWEHFSYLAVYQCRNCHEERGVPRRFRYHFGPACRCPRCGTTRLKKLRDFDPIDPMATGILNFLERLAGGEVYHCCFCRIQFYDRRSLLTRIGQEDQEESEETVAPEDERIMTPPDKASSGV
jgi:hypothetical protein